MKIALIGYGKMGHMIEDIALRRGHEIVCRIDVDNPQDFDSPEFAEADVAIEFTNPTAAYGNYLKAFAHDVKVVSGSTGWMKEHGDDVRKLCAEGGHTLFWASNFSVGVAIFSAVNRFLAKIMNGFPEYDVCMQETHHVHKLDAPSGTAISLAEDIIENVDRKKDWKRGVTIWTNDGHEDAGDPTAQGDLVINCVHSHGDVRLRGRHDHHQARRPQPERLRIGGCAGGRIHPESPRIAHDERPVQVLTYVERQ